MELEIAQLTQEHATLKKEHEETPWLDNRHVVFRHVIEGIKVLKKLESQETSRADVPKLPCKIVNSDELPADS
ncbi:hypothetical protein KSP40_PGU001599 [Platanthera guangdongensis]|uniref:PPIase cyclophilin-type domain-containing protein n=1 Tax=Platanthera guangdongensis TaxID=2320717 RepID=A0ABR2LD23_9ASPA